MQRLTPPLPPSEKNRLCKSRLCKSRLCKSRLCKSELTFRSSMPAACQISSRLLASHDPISAQEHHPGSHRPKDKKAGSGHMKARRWPYRARKHTTTFTSPASILSSSRRHGHGLSCALTLAPPKSDWPRAQRCCVELARLPGYPVSFGLLFALQHGARGS